MKSEETEWDRTVAWIVDMEVTFRETVEWLERKGLDDAPDLPPRVCKAIEHVKRTRANCRALDAMPDDMKRGPGRVRPVGGLLTDSGPRAPLAALDWRRPHDPGPQE